MSELSSALDSAFDSAISESTPASTPDAAPAPEPVEAQPSTPESAPKEAAAAPVETPKEEEPTGDVLLDRLTAEEIAAIKGDPKLRKVYAGLMKSYTPKMQEIAETKKLWDALNNQDTRRRAVEALAMSVGIELKPTDQPQIDQAARVADDISEQWSKVVGPEAAEQLRPLIEKTALAAVQGTIQPLQKGYEVLQQDIQQRQGQAQADSFRALAKEKGWTLNKDVETKMTEIGQQMAPTRRNPVTGQFEIASFETAEQGVQFLERVYRLATLDTVEADTEKRILERMNKAAQTAEPARGIPTTGREKRTGITREMSLNEAFDTAWDELGLSRDA